LATLRYLKAAFERIVSCTHQQDLKPVKDYRKKTANGKKKKFIKMNIGVSGVSLGRGHQFFLSVINGRYGSTAIFGDDRDLESMMHANFNRIPMI
jgi:hypothetical protein